MSKLKIDPVKKPKAKPVLLIVFMALLLVLATVALSAMPLAFATEREMAELPAGYAEAKGAAERVLGGPERGSLMEKAIAGLIGGLAAAIAGTTGMIPLDVLFFGENVRIDNERYKTWLFLNETWKDFAMPAYRVFSYVAYALMLLTIMSAGIKMGLTTWLSPSARANVSQMVFNWVVASVLLVALPAFFDLLLQLNSALVAIAFGLAGGNAPGAVPDLLRMGIFGGTVETGSILLSAVVNLAIAIFVLYFNIMFMLRWFIIVALFAVSPLVIWAWAKGQATAFFLWLGECISNVITQFVYAFVFALVLGITLVRDTEPPWWMYLVIMMVIIPLGTLLRRLITQWMNIIGLDEEGSAHRVTGAGVGSLMSVGSALAGGGRRAEMQAVGGVSSVSGGGGGGETPAVGGGEGAGGRGGLMSTITGNRYARAGLGALKTGAAVMAGTAVGLGAASVLGSQGEQLGAIAARGIRGFGMPSFRGGVGYQSGNASRQGPPGGGQQQTGTGGGQQAGASGNHQAGVGGSQQGGTGAGYQAGVGGGQQIGVGGSHHAGVGESHQAGIGGSQPTGGGGGQQQVGAGGSQSALNFSGRTGSTSPQAYQGTFDNWDSGGVVFR